MSADTEPVEAVEPTPDEGGASQEPEHDSAPTFQAITSQEEFERRLARRLGQERSKFTGFEDYKAKAAKFDELEDAKKTTEQRLTDELNALRKDNDGLRLDKLRSEVAAEKGLPAKFARRLTGTTREELEADADDLLDTLPKPEPKTPLSQKPKESLRGGGRPDEEPEEVDPRKLAARIPR